MKLLSIVVAVATMLLGGFSASAAEMPEPNKLVQAHGLIAGVTAPAIPGPILGKANVKKNIVLAQRRRRRRRRRGAAIGAGVALGILGIAAASQAARADDDEAYYRRQRCRRWQRRCNRGNDWACDKYDDRC